MFINLYLVLTRAWTQRWSGKHNEWYVRSNMYANDSSLLLSVNLSVWHDTILQFLRCLVLWLYLLRPIFLLLIVDLIMFVIFNGYFFAIHIDIITSFLFMFMTLILWAFVTSLDFPWNSLLKILQNQFLINNQWRFWSKNYQSVFMLALF